MWLKLCLSNSNQLRHALVFSQPHERLPFLVVTFNFTAQPQPRYKTFTFVLDSLGLPGTMKEGWTDMGQPQEGPLMPQAGRTCRNSLFGTVSHQNFLLSPVGRTAIGLTCRGTTSPGSLASLFSTDDLCRNPLLGGA